MEKLKFASYRSRIVGLAVALGVYTFIALSGHRTSGRGMVILTIAAVLCAVIPESPGKKPEPEKYHITSP